MFKRITFLSLFCMFLMTSVSLSYDIHSDTTGIYRPYGGFARAAAMGHGGFGVMIGEGVETLFGSPYLVDQTNTINNPAWMNTYRNRVYGNIDNNANGYIATYIGLNESFVLGITSVNRNLPGLNTISPMMLGDGLSENTRNSFQIAGAFQIEDITLGLGINYAASSDDDGTIAQSFTQFGLNFGAMMVFTDEFTLDGALYFAIPSYSAESENSETTINRFLLGLNARALITVEHNVILIPFVNLYNITGTSDSDGSDFDLESGTSIDFGFGANYIIGRLLLNGGISLGINSQIVPLGNEDQSNSQFIFPRWNFGAEYYLTSWLAARIGYSNSNVSNTLESLSSGNERTFTSYNDYGAGSFVYGVGFHFGRFSLDATVNDAVLRNGFSNFNGETPTFGFFSAHYYFGK